MNSLRATHFGFRHTKSTFNERQSAPTTLSKIKQCLVTLRYVLCVNPDDFFAVIDEQIVGFEQQAKLPAELLRAIPRQLDIVLDIATMPIGGWEDSSDGPLVLALADSGQMVSVVAVNPDQLDSLSDTLASIDSWLSAMTLPNLSELSGNSVDFYEGLLELSPRSSILLSPRRRFVLVTAVDQLDVTAIERRLPDADIDVHYLDVLKTSDGPAIIRRRVGAPSSIDAAMTSPAIDAADQNLATGREIFAGQEVDTGQEIDSELTDDSQLGQGQEHAEGGEFTLKPEVESAVIEEAAAIQAPVVIREPVVIQEPAAVTTPPPPAPAAVPTHVEPEADNTTEPELTQLADEAIPSAFAEDENAWPSMKIPVVESPEMVEAPMFAAPVDSPVEEFSIAPEHDEVIDLTETQPTIDLTIDETGSGGHDLRLPVVEPGGTYDLDILPLLFDETGESLVSISNELFAVNNAIVIVASLPEKRRDTPFEDRRRFRWDTSLDKIQLLNEHGWTVEGIRRSVHLFVESERQPRYAAYVGELSRTAFQTQTQVDGETAWFAITPSLGSDLYRLLRKGRLPQHADV